MNLVEAMQVLKYRPQIFEEMRNAAKKELSFEERVEYHVAACNLFEKHLKEFKESDARAMEAVKKSDKSLEAYKAQKVKRDLVPKNLLLGRTREQETFELGAIYAITFLDASEAELLVKRVGERLEALNVIGDSINATAQELKELGAQQGPDYFHKKDQPYYSGPANAPQMPTATDLLPGRAENPEISQCYCLYCHEYVPVEIDLSTNKRNCEMHVHKKCSRMLTSVIKIAGDKRPDSDDLARRTKHPHSGVKENILYKCPICTKVSQIQNDVDVRDKKTCPFCYAALSDKDVVDAPQKQ